MSVRCGVVNGDGSIPAASCWLPVGHGGVHETGPESALKPSDWWCRHCKADRPPLPRSCAGGPPACNVCGSYLDAPTEPHWTTRLAWEAGID